MAQESPTSLSKRHTNLSIDPSAAKPGGTKQNTSFNADQLAECKELFEIFDKNNDDYIDKSEFVPMMRALGLNLSKQELDMFFARMDDSGDGLIEFPELVQFLEGISRPLSAEEELAEAFDFFEPRVIEIERNVEASVIDPKSLYKIFMDMGEDISEQECADMIEAATGGKEVIDFKTFQRFCKSTKRPRPAASADA
mmetsp:Transcript_69279/g.122606  ORF Transcript_69279/g.122606 Transcript_69279/m.122606 type:complete len:197 (-) Transcript_69279:12-602(-)|eukprot:CAMPEP_0197627018 /NCGR_PEP_ID=MMETSP1338-20131121/5752_1 /TAXON_ID=43686 ORGANISM="Pelagodinium beii, Strain RCC1491" /NCGR_SAMPLE_ID=MMETSP1338 /ASSEMBLY_ACC=CAM_ASM_000754 /LENGTH=196 /DNA_ID=CAMNT_0043197629 /DNA_START=45 /DNA_END=635 /DNA_ORIENTATION=+